MHCAHFICWAANKVHNTLRSHHLPVSHFICLPGNELSTVREREREKEKLRYNKTTIKELDVRSKLSCVFWIFKKPFKCEYIFTVFKP